MKKIRFYTAVLSFLLAIIMLSSCMMLGEKEKVFTNSGLSVTLTDKFHEKEHISFTGYYQSSDMLVVTIKEEFSHLQQMDISENSTITEYLELVIYANQHSSKVEQKDGIYYFTYESEVSGKDFKYLATAVKSNDAFWLVQFGVLKDSFEKYEETIFKYADSVKVD